MKIEDIISEAVFDQNGDIAEDGDLTLTFKIKDGYPDDTNFSIGLEIRGQKIWQVDGLTLRPEQEDDCHVCGAKNRSCQADCIR